MENEQKAEKKEVQNKFSLENKKVWGEKSTWEMPCCKK